MPNPKCFDDRAAIQIRNKMRNQMAQMMRVSNDYYNVRKNAFV